LPAGGLSASLLGVVQGVYKRFEPGRSSHEHVRHHERHDRYDEEKQIERDEPEGDEPDGVFRNGNPLRVVTTRSKK
jgi:hypothetical protein